MSYPEQGSMDRSASRKLAARHAVQVIGYDDDVVVTYTKKMTDGSFRNFQRKGVYYIKNSWGTDWGNEGYAIVDRHRDCGITLIIDVIEVEGALPPKIYTQFCGDNKKEGKE